MSFKFLSFSFIIFFWSLVIFLLSFSFIFAQTDKELTGSIGKSMLIVGSYPVGIDINPLTGMIYVANQFSNTISVIDSKTDNIENTILVDNFPYDLDTNPFNNRVYVTNRGSGTVSVIDGSTNQKLSDVEVGSSPVGISVNPSKNLIYVTNLDSKSVSIIDGINNEVIKTIKLNHIPYGITLNPLTNKIYISNIDNSTVSVIDGKTNQVLDNITVGIVPTGLYIDLKTNILYAANYVSNTMSIIDANTNKIKSTVKVGKSPVDIAADSLSNKIYVSNLGDNTVSVINATTSEKIKDISLGTKIAENYESIDPSLDLPIEVAFPLVASRLAVNPDTKLIYVSNTSFNGISVIDSKLDQIVVRLSVNVNPENSGTVECNNYRFPSIHSILYPHNTEITCVAHASREKSFDFWSDMLSTNKNPVTFNVTENNQLTANFKDSISTETYIGMLAGILGSTSIFAGFYYRRRERRNLNKVMNRIDFTYDALKQDRIEGVKQLEEIREEINHLFKQGKITDSHYNILEKKIADLVNKLLRDG